MTYSLIEQRELKDLQGIGYVYEHEKTKAKVCFIQTDDENKTFSIAFRTPPSDDTGLPHILEHSVLCGSRKYPIKDPFIELAKGSLNTFLNAMTYSDKTMYPVASMNEQDFHNLIDVYMDAVFYPDIYNNPKTFMQEGWHYELAEEEGNVSYKGVVYNEMKGVFSSPEQILLRSIQKELFPNHPYGYESGGDPMKITQLTEDDFLTFHKTYYHPSNSFIFYYGDVCIEDELKWLDEAYLSAFDYQAIDSSIKKVERFDEMKEVKQNYPISEGEEGKNKTFLSYNVVLGESKQALEGAGFDILEYLMIDVPGAPIKDALLKAGIGEDVFSSFDGSIREGTFSIIAKNCRPEDAERFKAIIEKELDKLYKNGFDEKKIKAAINKFEFKAKEADFGQYPKGVIYAIKILETWLYDEDPFINLQYDEIYTKVKEETKNGLLNRLIKEYFIENNHKVILTLEPDRLYNQKKQAIIKKDLSDYEARLSLADRKSLVEQTQALIAYQESVERPEDLQKLPLLNLSDIDRDKKKFDFSEKMLKDTKLLIHKSNAANIAYLKCSFDVGFIEEEQLPILSLLSRMLIKVSTKKHNYGELADEINLTTGGLTAALSVYEHKSSTKYFQPRLELSGKCFVENTKELLELIREVLVETEFSDVERMRELINENKSRIQMRLNSSGHMTAITRVESYFSKAASYKERLRGIEFYEAISNWQQKSDEDLKELGTLLERLLKDIVSSDRLTIGITVTEDYVKQVKDNIEKFVFSMPYEEHVGKPCDVHLLEPANEGFKTPGDVQYVAFAADYRKHGFEYDGSMKVLNTILSLDYLWNNVRIKGGAYGAFSGIAKNGMIYFASYRDPNLEETLKVYENVSKFIEAVDMDERELTKYIIGTISPLDQPLTPSLQNDKMMTLYYSETTDEDIQSNRHQILDTTVEKMKGHLEMYQKIFLDRAICVVGSEKAINETKGLFSKIYDLN